MIAGLLYYHGVWIGEAKVTASPETNPLLGTENIHIKNYLKKLGFNVGSNVFREDILKFVETDGPWLVKTGQVLLKWQYWRGAFPDAKWILPVRDTDEIIASMKRHPGMRHRSEDDMLRRITRAKELQAAVIASGANIFSVNPKDIATGNESIARWLIEECGLEFNQEAWQKWIEPERWHGH